MKRSRPIQRKSGLTPGRARLRPTARRKQAARSAYAGKAREFIEANPTCQACGYISEMAEDFREANPTIQVHHKAGRNGALLLDERYWLPVCLPCHEWIHGNGKLARAIGLILDLQTYEKEN